MQENIYFAFAFISFPPYFEVNYEHVRVHNRIASGFEMFMKMKEIFSCVLKVKFVCVENIFVGILSYAEKLRNFA